jgi:hypothetical protein
VRTSFSRNGADFGSVLGRVTGNLYIGRTSAGGRGDSIDLNNDGTVDVSFSQTCDFVLQLDAGKVTAIEADRAVTATLAGRVVQLAPYTPVAVSVSDYASFQGTWFDAAQQADVFTSGPLADANADGVPNLLAYAAGLDPWTPATNANFGRPSVAVSEERLMLSYARPFAVSDIDYTVEVSGDLASWYSGSGYTTELGRTPLDERRERVDVRDDLAFGDTSRRFIRLRVAQVLP